MNTLPPKELNPPPTMKKHAGIKGLRLFVFKPGRCGGYTTIYVKQGVVDELLLLVDGNRRALSSMARIASSRTTTRKGYSWGQCVIANARRMLIAWSDAADAPAREAAAENNRAWEKALANEQGQQ